MFVLEFKGAKMAWAVKILEKFYIFVVSEKYKSMNLLDYWVKNAGCKM